MARGTACSVRRLAGILDEKGLFSVHILCASHDVYMADRKVLVIIRR